MIDLMAIAAIDRETEVTYIRKERDWAARAAADGRIVDPGRLLPMLPASIAGGSSNGGNGHDHDNGDGHGGHAASTGGHAGHG
jgi:hypothetical protein